MTGLIINGQPGMSKAFEKRRGFTVTVECGDRENNAIVLTGDRFGSAFVYVEVKPKAKNRRKCEREDDPYHRFLPLPHAITLLC